MKIPEPHTQELLRQFDRYTIIVAIGSIIVLSVAYFVLGSFNLSPGSIWDMARQFAMSLITNLIPVFLLFAVTYALFRQVQQIKSEQEIESLVGKIGKAVNSELEGISTELEEQRGLLEQNLGGRPLERDEIYPAVTRVIGVANEHIRIILLESRPAPPDDVLEAIAERLHKKKVQYDLVIVLKPNSTDLGRYKDTHENLVRRLESRSQDAKERYTLYVLETKKTICFDTLIVDDQHIGIGFTRFRAEKDVQNAIMFTNHPELAKKFAEWFDKMIVPQSQLYEEWVALRQSVNNKLDT
jgi:membrane protein implicated in regulation of membrane protease activity